MSKPSTGLDKPHLSKENSLNSEPSHGVNGMTKQLQKASIEDLEDADQEGSISRVTSYGYKMPKRSDTLNSTKSDASLWNRGATSSKIGPEDDFEARPGYKQCVAQAGTRVADLLTSAGADHVITMDLHDPQYQGFFDIPVDNLYGRAILKRYIQQSIPNFQQAVVVSPDAGGAKRATAIADSLGMPFALIHKVSRHGNLIA